MVEGKYYNIRYNDVSYVAKYNAYGNYLEIMLPDQIPMVVDVNDGNLSITNECKNPNDNSLDGIGKNL